MFMNYFLMHAVNSRDHATMSLVNMAPFTQRYKQKILLLCGLISNVKYDKI